MRRRLGTALTAGALMNGLALRGTWALLMSSVLLLTVSAMPAAAGDCDWYADDRTETRWVLSGQTACAVDSGGRVGQVEAGGTFVGGPGPDLVTDGLRGTFRGNGGDDVVEFGVGEDGLFIGGPGDDHSGAAAMTGRFIGGPGDDTCGRDAAGVFIGGPGDDSATRVTGRFIGGAGDDTADECYADAKVVSVECGL